MYSSDCVARGILSKTSKSIDVTVLHEQCLSWPAFQLRSFSKKHQGREGIIGSSQRKKTANDKYCKQEDCLDSLGFLSVEIKNLLSLYYNSRVPPPPKLRFLTMYLLSSLEFLTATLESDCVANCFCFHNVMYFCVKQDIQGESIKVHKGGNLFP